MKNILLGIVVLAVIGGGAYWYTSSSSQKAPEVSEEQRAGTPEEKPAGKLKVGNFSGKLEEVNTGCFSDGECYVVVDGKHITVLMGWSRETVGAVLGVEGFGDLEGHLKEEVEVYAQDKGDGTYTLYGSEGFYVKLK